MHKLIEIHVESEPVATQIPEYENPPVSEVAISVRFVPLANWKGPYAGLYWSRIFGDYPTVDIKPPLLPQTEKFDADFFPAPFRLGSLNLEEFSDFSRVLFIGKKPTDLIQLQRDRFIINWRKVAEDEVYPRYEPHLRPRFLIEWERFKQFAQELSLGEIDVQQCEITYVNDIVRGTDWDTISDLPGILSQWSDHRSEKFLPEIETLALSGSFAMPERQGRLWFSIQHLRRETDQKEVIQLQLTARGRPSSNSSNNLMEWMDKGREWVVRGFTDLTTHDAQTRWKRKA